MIFFGTIFNNFLFDTVYATFGWWFVAPGLTTYGGVFSYGNWAFANAADYLSNWFFTQYILFFYYSWLLSALFQVIISRKPTYEQLIIRGIRYHNNSVSFFFLFVIHFYDFFFLMRTPSDFLYAFQVDVFFLKLFLVFQILDMNFFMYASALIIWHDYTDRIKLFGTYQVRNTRARNRQLREAVVLNTFISLITVPTLVYCIAPEFWNDDKPIDLWVTFIYRLPYYNYLVTSGCFPAHASYGNISDYSPKWYYPNYVRGTRGLMPWVKEPESKLVKW